MGNIRVFPATSYEDMLRVSSNELLNAISIERTESFRVEMYSGCSIRQSGDGALGPVPAVQRFKSINVQYHLLSDWKVTGKFSEGASRSHWEGASDGVGST
jgi:hypothetical protein